MLLGGLIPILGALAVGYIIYRAVRDNDEDRLEPTAMPWRLATGPT